MNKPGQYKIEIEDVIGDRWSAWFEDLAVCQVSDKETILTGELSDQAALLGVLANIHALNLKFVRVHCSVFCKQ
ncbi:MAG: hypothetical protein ACK2UV_08515 [Candidatus Promineifilaceae bacterium]